MDSAVMEVFLYGRAQAEKSAKQKSMVTLHTDDSFGSQYISRHSGP